MPNQGNRSKPDTGIVKKKRKPTMPATDKQNTEGNANNDTTGGTTRRGDKGSSAKKGSKTGSGDSKGD